MEVELKTTDSEVGCDFNKIMITKWRGQLITRFNTRALSDPCEGFVAGEKLEFPYEVTSMKINYTNYDKLDSLFVDVQPYFSRDQTFNIVYYDSKHGIIVFNGNGNNSKYRLVKE